MPSSSAQTGSACGDADPQPAGGGGRASAVSPQLVGRARGRAAVAAWSLAPGSLLRTPRLTQGLGLAPGAWHRAGSWEDARDAGRNTAMGETGKGDGKGPRRHLPLPARSCAAGVSQSSLSGAAARFPVAHAFLSGAPCLLGGRACPRRGYGCNWDVGEEREDKELCDLCVARLHKTSGGCRERPPAFAPPTSVVPQELLLAQRVSLFKSAGL